MRLLIETEKSNPICELAELRCPRYVFGHYQALLSNEGLSREHRLVLAQKSSCGMPSLKSLEQSRFLLIDRDWGTIHAQTICVRNYLDNGNAKSDNLY